MADELIDIYDENNEPLGISKMRSEAYEKGLWHRAAHVWIYNSQGDILFQLRAKEKNFYPNVWTASAAGGHIEAGEDAIISAIRELKEEIGLVVSEESLYFLKVMKEERIYGKMINNEFHYIYALKFNGDVSDLKLQTEEVQRIKFFSIDKINKELKANSGKYLIEKNYWESVASEVQRIKDGS